MQRGDRNEVEYRFAVLGARGTITLAGDVVHSKTWTYLGWWRQTIPLADLKPRYSTLNAIWPLFPWLYLVAIVLFFVGLYGLTWSHWAMPQKGLAVLLMVIASLLRNYLWRHRRSDWIIISASDHGLPISYTRQGPDAGRCDTFTEQLLTAIRAARETG